jgi:hypothetical protein
LLSSGTDQEDAGLSTCLLKSGSPFRLSLILGLALGMMVTGTQSALGGQTPGAGERTRLYDTCRPGVHPAPAQENPRYDVLIICHAGGWGNVPLKYTDDLRPVVLGIEEYLESRGLRTKVIQYNRLPHSPLGEFIITSELWGLHTLCARRYAHRLERILHEHPDLLVVMVGLSNGAAFSNAVMAQLEDWTFDRVLSIECGPPVYYFPVESDRILTIIRPGQDPLFSEHPDLVLSNTVGILVDMVVSLLTGSPLSFQTALRESGHEYPWLEIAPEVTAFIDSWLDGRATSPASSHTGQE